jgi:ribosomal protein S18 acetylase RimI-like enzyme
MSEGFELHTLNSASFMRDPNVFTGVGDVFREPFGIDHGLLTTLAQAVVSDFVIATDTRTGQVGSAAAVLHVPRKSMEIVFLATAPDMQNRKLATGVINEVEHMARRKDTAVVRASVENYRKGMQNLLASLGYTQGSRGLGGEFEKRL